MSGATFAAVFARFASFAPSRLSQVPWPVPRYAPRSQVRWPVNRERRDSARSARDASTACSPPNVAQGNPVVHVGRNGHGSSRVFRVFRAIASFAGPVAGAAVGAALAGPVPVLGYSRRSKVQAPRCSPQRTRGPIRWYPSPPACVQRQVRSRNCCRTRHVRRAHCATTPARAARETRWPRSGRRQPRRDPSLSPTPVRVHQRTRSTPHRTPAPACSRTGWPPTPSRCAHRPLHAP
jgi:hypothetical protein